jgi:Trk/Ktr/HKT type cation transporter
VSAYGTVGLSMGFPNVNAALCSQFSTLGKLIIIAMQIRGRHRGLPYGLDRAILLPSEQRFKEEAAELPATLLRTNTAASQGTTSGFSRRQVTIRRGRSMDRMTPSIITSFLHPGPAMEMHHKHNRARSRTRSMDDPRRTNSMPVETDDDEPELNEHMRPVRAKTFSGNPAVPRGL